jgi:leader peptidase (prepilin peptidase)/N-methyltransferase
MRSAAVKAHPIPEKLMLDDVAFLQAHYPYFWPVVAFLFGSAIGSFLNVVVYRLPVMMMQDWREQSLEIIHESTEDEALVESVRQQLPAPQKPFNLVVPNSTCPSCGTAIKPWHNIPIIGWFIIGGKCASCSTPVSARYPTVEAATAILTALVIFMLGPTLQGLAACVLTWALIALALIDFDTQLLPDSITLPFLWLGLIVNFFGVFVPFPAAFLGAVLGYLVLWTVYQLFKLATGKEGMGFGDFKMLAMLGAWLGAASLPLIIIVSSFAGALIGGALILAGRDRSVPLKFGPFLAIAGFIALLWGNELIDLYLQVTLGT